MTSVGTVLSNPIPPYQNLPINAQFYQPSNFKISNVTLGITTTITTTVNHNYVVGQQIRLIIPNQYGCFQLNESQGIVLSIPAANQVIVTINSSQNVSQFIAAAVSNVPQILGIGDVNNGQTNLNGRTKQGTFVPGSFINISP